MDAAKALLALAKKATGPEKAKLMAEALQIVTDGSKVRSEHQQELFALRRELLKDIGRNLEVNTFDDAVAAGDAAVASSEWEKALAAYNKGLEIAEKTKLRNPNGIATVREAAGRVQFMMACDLFNKGKLDECIDMVGKIVRDQDGNVKKESAAAAQASALGVSAALNLYVAAPNDKKPAALERLMKVAEFTEKNWPDKPEADDARMARGQAKLAVGQVREAIDVFDRVNPKSERYATAMYWAGQNYWRLYVTAKLGSQSAPDKDQMAANRAKAVERLTTALNILKKQYEPGKPLPKYMLDTQLLLAEVYNEGGEAKEAAALYQPLVDLIKAEKPQIVRHQHDPHLPRRRPRVLRAERPGQSRRRQRRADRAWSRHAPDQRRAGRVRQTVEPGAQEGRGAGDGIGEQRQCRRKSTPPRNGWHPCKNCWARPWSSCRSEKSWAWDT